MENYHLIEEIGSGSYGKVYRATEKATNRSIAVKLIKRREHERKEQKKFLKECSIHNSLTHPNIIQMLNSFETTEHIVVVTELAGIDLHRFMSSNQLSEKQVNKLACDLLSALYYLHSHRVLHRDLKPQNILLNNFRNIDEMDAKLCDFGLARKMNSETYLLTSVKGTPLYMAPEVMFDGCYDEGADLWSAGCIIYEAHFRKPPIKTNSFAQLNKWLRNPKIEWPSSIPETQKSILVGLLKKEPQIRLAWPEILVHPYVRDKLIILSDEKKLEHPLTEDLTTSQQIRKDKQRDEIIFKREKKIIAVAMSKCQQTKLKINQAACPFPNTRKKSKNIIDDNESISSDDSVNAIIQTDLETDVEGPLIKKQIKLQEPETIDRSVNQNQNLIIQRYTDNFAAIEEVTENTDNANFKIGTMLENIEKMHIEDENKWCLAKGKPLPFDLPQERNVTNIEIASSINQVKANTELEKCKLSQNLENLSVRRSNDDENDRDNLKEKGQCITIKNGPENSDLKEDYEDDQSPPIENEEWIAFVHMSMKEILNGETDSLKNQNLVGLMVALLRNFNASSTVIGNIGQLLSIPFVLPISNDDLIQIKSVYLQTKLLPNLIFASKIVCMVKTNNPSFSSTLSSSNFAALSTTQEHVVFEQMTNLTGDQLKTLACIYELVCYLVHLNENFLVQFCDSVYIIARDLLRHLLSDVVYDLQGMQLVCAIVSILCFVLRETPENAELVESVIFHESVDITGLLHNGNVLLRIRLLNLLKIVGRFSCFSLEKAWTKGFKQVLEGLLDGENAKVKEAARDAMDELRHLSFYNI